MMNSGTSVVGARQILQPGEKALLIRTDGRNLAISDGDGTSGNWKLSPTRQVDTVLIYASSKARWIRRPE